MNGAASGQAPRLPRLPGQRVTFVTGVSGAGKTTLADELAPGDDHHRRLEGGEAGGLWVVDLDRQGRPNACHVEWLRWRAAELLHAAATWEADTGGRPAGHLIVTGICWPHAVVDSNAWPVARKAGLAVEFIMLDVPHRVIRERLTQRPSASKKGFRALMRYNHDLAAILRHQTEEQRNGYVVDAEDMAPAAIADYVQRAPVDRWPL